MSRPYGPVLTRLPRGFPTHPESTSGYKHVTGGANVRRAHGGSHPLLSPLSPEMITPLARSV